MSKMTFEDLRIQFPGILFTSHRPVGKFGVIAVVAYDPARNLGCRYEGLENETRTWFKIIADDVKKHLSRNEPATTKS